MKDDLRNLTNAFPRRRVLAGATVAAGGFALTAKVALAAAVETSLPGQDAEMTRTSLHQEVEFNAAPQRIYDVLLDSKEFAAFSGHPAVIDPAAGGAFSMFDGIIVGRNIELVPGQRIVQAWKPNYWEPGIYSLVKFELVADGAGTKIVLDHWGFPEGKFAGLDSGWPERYWQPLTKYLSEPPK
jgi:activator of HSP90 ATPase